MIQAAQKMLNIEAMQMSLPIAQQIRYLVLTTTGVEAHLALKNMWSLNLCITTTEHP